MFQVVVGGGAGGLDCFYWQDEEDMEAQCVCWELTIGTLRAVLNGRLIKAKTWEISSDTHQLRFIPKHHFII